MALKTDHCRIWNQLETHEVSSKTIAIRKRDLAIKLQTIELHPTPRVTLEQYTIPADLAAEILFCACYVHDDVENKSVLDLGAGTGRLALGASILRASQVVGVDLDQTALEVAVRSCRRLGLEANWVLGDIKALRGPVDTVFMNPPFGTKRAHADTDFLGVALRLGDAIYSIHKSSTRSYLERWFREHDVDAERMISTKLEIPHQFPFHKKKRAYVEVDVYRIVHN